MSAQYMETKYTSFVGTNGWDKIMLIGGRSNPNLIKSMTEFSGTEFSRCELSTFGNGEINVKLLESVRGSYVYIIQTGATVEDRSEVNKLLEDPEFMERFNKDPKKYVDEIIKRNSIMTVNDNLVELLLLCSACKRCDAKYITLIIPCMPYARSDKKDHRGTIAARDCIDCFDDMGADRIITLDAHFGQIQGFISGKPFDNLYGINLLIDYMKKNIFVDCQDLNNNFVLVSPDAGGAKRVESYSKILKLNNVILHKRRDYSKMNTVLDSILIGKPEWVKDKICIIIDDIIDTAGTMCKSSELLMSYGAKHVILVATHGIFSKNAFENINGCDSIKKVVVTNSIGQEFNRQKCQKIDVVDIGPLLVEVIRRLLTGESLSALFEQK